MASVLNRDAPADTLDSQLEKIKTILKIIAEDHNAVICEMFIDWDFLSTPNEGLPIVFFKDMKFTTKRGRVAISSKPTAN